MRESKLVQYIVLGIAVIGMVIIPLRIIGYGFLPQDDALRHSAKVISGKNWDEILVIRDDIKMDTHPGWHYILNVFHKATGANTERLVVFSVVSLFALFCLIPLFLIKRQEAWLAALLTFIIFNPSFAMRLLLGRPYIITMTAIAASCCCGLSLIIQKRHPAQC